MKNSERLLLSVSYAFSHSLLIRCLGNLVRGIDEDESNFLSMVKVIEEERERDKKKVASLCTSSQGYIWVFFRRRLL